MGCRTAEVDGGGSGVAGWSCDVMEVEQIEGRGSGWPTRCTGV